MRQLDEVVGQMKSGTPFELLLGESDLANIANTYANGKIGLPLNDIAVAITLSEMIVTAKTKLASLPINVKVVGIPRLTEGRVQFDISAIDLNGSAAPMLVRNQVLATLNEKLDPSNLPVDVHDIELATGAVKVTGIVK